MDRQANTADVVAVLLFPRRFPFEEFRSLIGPRLLQNPLLRRRIVSSGFPGSPCWEEDPEFSLSQHLMPRRLDGLGQSALEDLVSAVATESLDFRHPPWRVYLVEAPGHGSAVVAKLHHCMGDGFALVGLLLSLMDEDTEARRNGPADATRSRFGVRLPRGGLVHRGRAFARALLRMVTLPDDPRTLFKRPLHGRRRVAWSDGVSLLRVQRVARDRHATVNDVLAAALTGALRRCLATAGEPVDTFDLRALMPVNLRAAPIADGELSNRFGLVFLDLPVHCAFADERLEAVKDAMRRLKRSPDSRVTFSILGVMGRVPEVIEQRLVDFFTRKASLVVTNVPGPKKHLHLGGVRLNHMIFWVPHPALLGLGVSILSYAGEIRVGVRADEAVLPRPAELVAGFEEELARLLRTQAVRGDWNGRGRWQPEVGVAVEAAKPP